MMDFDSDPIYEPQNFRLRETTPSSDGSGDLVLAAHERRQQQGMSALSSNLSELDQLLQDLSSAQAEMDRRNAGGDTVVVVNGGGPGSSSSGKAGPPTLPKPGRGQRNTVDSLLDQLESSVPSPPGHSQQQQQQQQRSYQNNYSTVEPGYHDGTPPFPVAQPAGTGASSATRELDELMSSLSEFKIQSQAQGQQAVINQEPAYAKPQKSRSLSATSPTGAAGNGGVGENNQLETMLGDLSADMNRQGVSTKTKGVCAACNKAVVGQVITALGKIWHIEHFTCAQCNQALGTQNFYERDGRAYCEPDYHGLFAPRCSYCNGPIVDKCVTALGKSWHPEHFLCAQCGHMFGDEGFHERDGKAYCKDDYFAMFAPKCGGCGHPIMDSYIQALNRHWHPECFVCWECRSPFGARSFYDHEGLPYCETHYHAKRGSLCASCQKPITGRCITAMYKKFHPEHFICAFCTKQLNKGTFKEQNDKPYCHPCFVKLFG